MDNTTLLGHTVTSTGYSTLNSGLLNVVSLSRSAGACVDVYCLLVCLVAFFVYLNLSGSILGI